MTDELTDYEELGENFAETAEELAEQFHEDHSLPDEPVVRMYPVFSGNRVGQSVEFTILNELHEQETVEGPWPDDTSDPTEPLVRLTQYLDVPLSDITQLDAVPVYTDGEDYELVVPPKPESLHQKAFYVLPQAFRFTIEEGPYRRTTIRARLTPVATLVLGVLQVLVATALFTTVFGTQPVFEVLRTGWTLAGVVTWLGVITLGVLALSGVRFVEQTITRVVSGVVA